jgi:cell division protein FtsI (penicillin-binding protein 3)
LADPRRRLHVSLLMVCAVLSLMAGRLVQLQGLDASTYAEAARNSRTQVVSVPALRGPILDRHGEPLAKSVEAYDVVVDQVLVQERGNPAAYALQLEGLLAQDAASLQRKLTGERRYRVLERQVSPETWRAISGLGLAGIFGEPTQERIYPAGVAGNVVGFVGAEGAGLAGLEQSRQDHLAGVDGELVYQVAGGGVRIPLGSGHREDAVAGEGLRLTLDRDIQWYTEQVLADQVDAAQASGGNVVVMDTRTGEIVAMATAPGLDPNDPAAADGPGGGNRVVEVAYEPGSVLKPVSIAAVVEEGMAGPATVLSVPDNITRANLTIRDYYNHPEQGMTVAGILAKSSNVGTILATERISPDVFGDYLQRFGLGAQPGLGLPAETGGRLPGEWTSLDRDFASFGQGISVNTVHLASAYATLANGGIRMPARLIDATVDAEGTETEVPAGQPERVVSEETADAVTAMLEAVMGPEGTGSRITVDGYRVAGKTGTAQRIDPNCGCYAGAVDVSFVGYAPAEDPRYAVAVTIFDPKRGRSGGGLGGPVFADVMTFTLARTGVPPSEAEPSELRLFVD